MKDYSNVNTSNWRELLAELKDEVNEGLKGTRIHCGKFINGVLTQLDGEIEEVSDILLQCNQADIMIRVHFDNDLISTYSLNMCARSSGFKMDDEKKDYVKEALEVAATILDYDQIERTELFAAKLNEEKKAAEAAKQAERDKKKLEKLKNHRAELIRQLDGIHTPIHTESDFYVSLGYIAKHIGTISATIPTWAESWFVKKFGTAEKKVVDETRKTVNGYSMKFAPSFSLSLKKAKNVPADIQALADTSKKSFTIHNTELVFDLVDNYGFKFGKEQDIEDIKKKIPNNYLANFDMGYAMS